MGITWGSGDGGLDGKVLVRSGGNCFEVKFNNEAEVAFRLLCHWKLVSNR